MLKAKLAKLRKELLEPAGGSGGGGDGRGFDVNKVGDARVGLVGFPSVGKSTLLTKLTGTFSEAAAYEFTTLTAVPGTLRYRGARIQIVDLPGIIEGAKDGKGRGRQVIATARTCNLILIVLDAIKPVTHKRLIEHELEGFGIRLNKQPPNITFKRKDKGGIALVNHSENSALDFDAVKAVCQEYRIHNADITIRGDYTVDDLIDVIEGNRICEHQAGARPDAGQGIAECTLLLLLRCRYPLHLCDEQDRPDLAGGAQHPGPHPALLPHLRVPRLEPGRPLRDDLGVP